MAEQPGKEEEVRNIYIRASTLFVPISRPGIRMQWAYFEESCGRVGVALDIHAAILMKLPDCVEVIVSWANLERRQNGAEAAIQVLKDQIDAPTVDLYTKAALVAEWAMLLWKGKNSTEEARAVFLKNVQWYADSRIFWDKWFQLELEQSPEGKEGETDQTERVKHVFDEFRSRSRLPNPVKRELAQVYMNFLMQRGGKDAMKEFLTVDRQMFGSVQHAIPQETEGIQLTLTHRPVSVSTASKSGSGAKENGASLGELDEASKRKAQIRYLNFYEAHPEPNAEAQGAADFN
jgi:pre-mRNA-processing factor 39